VTVAPPAPRNKKPAHSPHFFVREPDGSVRLRIRFTAEEASVIEEAAGATPLMLYIHRVLAQQARFHIERAREGQPILLGPDDGDEPIT
jgi:hypothetical protein